MSLYSTPTLSRFSLVTSEGGWIYNFTVHFPICRIISSYVIIIYNDRKKLNPDFEKQNRQIFAAQKSEVQEDQGNPRSGDGLRAIEGLRRRA